MPKPKSVIMVVEDDHLVLLHSTMALEDAGYEVLPVPDAAAALASLAERDDVAARLTDVNLPGALSGVSLAHSVRQARPDMHIVLTSGSPLPAGQALPAGGRFMMKPYTARQMQRVLEG